MRTADQLQLLNQMTQCLVLLKGLVKDMQEGSLKTTSCQMHLIYNAACGIPVSPGYLHPQESVATAATNYANMTTAQYVHYTAGNSDSGSRVHTMRIHAETFSQRPLVGIIPTNMIFRLYPT